MDMQWLLAMLPLVALFVNVMIQISSIHLIFRIGLSIVLGLMSGFLILLALFCFFLEIGNSISIIDICVGILTYIALSFCFWAFLNLNITSLRIRLMRELLKVEDKGLSTEILLQYYSPEELIKRRIERLERSGQIKIRDGKWVLQSQKLLIFIFVSTLLRKIIIPPKYIIQN